MQSATRILCLWNISFLDNHPFVIQDISWGRYRTLDPV